MNKLQIELLTPLVFSSTVQPIVQAPRLHDPSTLGNAQILGWGFWQLDPDEVSPILQYAHVTILSSEECADVTAGTYLPLENTICTGPVSGGVGGCNGDSGGPMIQVVQNDDGSEEYIQIGVAAWAIRPCGAPRAPTGYVGTTYFRDWIDELVY